VELTLSRTPSFAINRQDTGRIADAIIAKEALLRVIAILFAALHAVLAITAAMEKSPTFDEPTHLTAGYSYWLKNDYRLDPENGNWSARWAALPLLLSRPSFPENAAWKQGDVGRVSERFLYGSGNNSDRVVLLGRSMMAVVGAGLCLLIFFCSNRLFGAIGGLISELLAVFDPNLLAHSALVTVDVAAAFFFTAAIWSYFRLLQSANKSWFVVTALSWSGLFLAKMSAPAFLLAALILATLRVVSGEPMTIRVIRFNRQVAARWRKLVLVAGLTGALVAVVVVAIWASFAFRFSPFAQNEPAREVWDAQWQACLSDHTMLENTVAFARDHRLLPEAYLYGFVFTSERAVNKNVLFRPAFLDGEWSNTGFISFFPRAFLYKTPVPLLLLLITAGVAGFLRWRNAWKNDDCGVIGRDLRRLSPIWALVLVYGTFSLTSYLNIGHRHLLPIYPAIFIACGACTYFFRTQSGKAIAIFAGAMMCWQIVESSLLRPDYLTYFNQLAGGPKNGYKHLVDSSLDWGQDLPALKTWLDQQPNQSATGRLYLAYFGTALPRYYGIEATGLPFDSSADKMPAFEPGTYCISATTLQHVYSFEHGKWTREYESAYRLALARAVHHFDLAANDSFANDVSLQRLRFARLCAYLRKREPTANVGNSILVFQLNQQELDQALYGPPVELASSL
jgi:4-amino-4-deoxy-L-arabinose transferase-like glycosyltransferase